MSYLPSRPSTRSLSNPARPHTYVYPMDYDRSFTQDLISRKFDVRLRDERRVRAAGIRSRESCLHNRDVFDKTVIEADPIKARWDCMSAFGARPVIQACGNVRARLLNTIRLTSGNCSDTKLCWKTKSEIRTYDRIRLKIAEANNRFKLKEDTTNRLVFQDVDEKEIVDNRSKQCQVLPEVLTEECDRSSWSRVGRSSPSRVAIPIIIHEFTKDNPITVEPKIGLGNVPLVHLLQSNDARAPKVEYEMKRFSDSQLLTVGRADRSGSARSKGSTRRRSSTISSRSKSARSRCDEPKHWVDEISISSGESKSKKRSLTKPSEPLSGHSGQSRVSNWSKRTSNVNIGDTTDIRRLVHQVYMEPESKE